MRSDGLMNVDQFCEPELMSFIFKSDAELLSAQRKTVVFGATWNPNYLAALRIGG
jgi:hypothetical protein